MSFSSFYIGATGMKTHGEGLQVISNNLANVNTIGYKESAYRFQDLMGDSSISGGTVNGYHQPGQGVSLQTVAGDFSQGSVLSSNSVTDLSISGKGFFGVSNMGDIFYTRAGNFLFNQMGDLVDPHGYVVQGASGDIRLDMVNGEPAPMDPQATTTVELVSNLSGADASGSAGSANPFFGMFDVYNGADATDPGLGGASYAFNDGIRIYDAQGVGHDLNVYYDAVDSTDISNAGSTRYWEYMVSMVPSEDGRAGFTGTSGAGLLMFGTMAFNTAGSIQAQSAFTYSGSGDVKDLSNWSPATPVDGSFRINPTFLNGTSSTISVNFGMSLSGAAGSGVSNASAVGLNPANLPGYTGTPASVSATAYEGSASTLRSSQNGFPTGYLQRMSVDHDGNIVGYYTNSQNQTLDRLQLFRFPNEYDLHREGENLFSANARSGDAIAGNPNSGGFGSINQNSLENSNVDMAREFVLMIQTQRGFQASSKVITTTDQLLQTAVNMKR